MTDDLFRAVGLMLLAVQAAATLLRLYGRPWLTRRRTYEVGAASDLLLLVSYVLAGDRSWHVVFWAVCLAADVYRWMTCRDDDDRRPRRRVRERATGARWRSFASSPIPTPTA